MNTILKILILFLVVSVASAVLVNLFGMELGNVNYWQMHGVLFLICIAIFPRLTLLFSSVPFGGLFWWLGWLFAPRLLVALLATVAYWNNNKILVLLAWLFAIGGESTEKYYVHRRARVVRVGPARSSSSRHTDGPTIDLKETKSDHFE